MLKKILVPVVAMIFCVCIAHAEPVASDQKQVAVEATSVEANNEASKKEDEIYEDADQQPVASSDDSFIDGLDDAKLLEKLEELDEQNQDLPFCDKFRLAIEFIKISSKDMATAVGEHFKTHYPKYIIGASVTAVVISIILIIKYTGKAPAKS